MKVYMSTDLEGVAGVVTFGVQTFADGKYYDEARRLLTAEVNAATEGMVEMGVEDILVADWHGPGAISYPDLKPPARLLHGRPMAPWSVQAEIIGQHDAAMIIGQHAMAGGERANLNHTQSSARVDSYKLNGRPIGEIVQFALFFGDLGVPVIFLSGDDAACREAEDCIPGIATVSVKTGVSRNSAISLAAPEARRRIREGVKDAIRRHLKTPVQPLRWPGPYVLEKRYFHTDAADGASDTQGAERVDSQTVRFRSEKIREIIYR